MVAWLWFFGVYHFGQLVGWRIGGLIGGLVGGSGRTVGGTRPIRVCAVCGCVVFWVYDVDGGQVCGGRKDET